MIALGVAFVITALSVPTSEFSVTRPDCVLAGELLAPPNAKTLAVIIAGSGPTDRDGNSKLGLTTNAYRDTAQLLAKAGVAVARYDKRGVGKSTYPGNRAPVFTDFVDDAAAIVEHFRARFPRIVLVGHSEGGLIALSLAARPIATGKKPIAQKLVLLATAGRPLAVVLREQLGKQSDAAVLGAYDRIVAQLERGETPTVPPALQPLFAPAVYPFLQSMLKLDPVALVKQIDLPVVVLQGETDIQVSRADADLLAAARPGKPIGKVIVPQANHVFRHEPTATLRQKSYTDPTAPFAPGYAEAIVKAVGK